MAGVPYRLAAALAMVALAVAGALGTLSAGADRASAQVGGRPNFVVIQTDDQTYASLVDRRVGRRTMPKTRSLLIDQGTTFENYFATHPRCCPSRASLLTGQYSHNHGIVENYLGYARFDHQRALPVWLDDAGYTTGQIGKLLNGYRGSSLEALPVPPGWDDWRGEVTANLSLYDYDLVERSPGASEPRTRHFGNRTRDYQTDVYARLAANFITARASEPEPDPFFLMVNPAAPHKAKTDGLKENPQPAPRHRGSLRDEDLPRPPSFSEKDVSDKPGFIRRKSRIGADEERTIERRYQDRLTSLRAIDDLVERVVQTLSDTGALGNTVIVFTSDNGFFQGEHRIAGGKIDLYEEAVHLPLVVRGPGVPPGATRQQLVGNIDLAPTILELAGAKPDEGHEIDGQSLLPFIQDPAAVGRRDLLLDNGASGSKGVRTHRWAYYEHPRGRELYDLKRDPHQLQSLHDRARDQDRLRQMADKLSALSTCAGESCRAP